MKPEADLKNIVQNLNKAAIKPPSVVIKEKLQGLKSPLDSGNIVTSTARSVFLSVDEVQMWIDHLQLVSKNRKKVQLKLQLHVELNCYRLKPKE